VFANWQPVRQGPSHFQISLAGISVRVEKSRFHSKKYRRSQHPYFLVDLGRNRGTDLRKFLFSACFYAELKRFEFRGSSRTPNGALFRVDAYPFGRMLVAQNTRLTSPAHLNRSQRCTDEGSYAKDARATAIRTRCRNLITCESKLRFALRFRRQQA